MIPEGIGERDHKRVGICMPEPGKVIFRDPDGKETELSVFDLIDIGARLPDQIRWMVQEEHRKAKRDER